MLSAGAACLPGIPGRAILLLAVPRQGAHVGLQVGMPEAKVWFDFIVWRARVGKEATSPSRYYHGVKVGCAWPAGVALGCWPGSYDRVNRRYGSGRRLVCGQPCSHIASWDVLQNTKNTAGRFMATLMMHDASHSRAVAPNKMHPWASAATPRQFAHFCLAVILSDGGLCL